jgi:hypothetical protein
MKRPDSELKIMKDQMNRRSDPEDNQLMYIKIYIQILPEHRQKDKNQSQEAIIK